MFESMCNGFWKSRHSHNANKLRVFINVYDMLEPSLLTNIGDTLGVGIYHSGVEVAGREYCFGGHEYENLTGVFAVEPKIGPPGVLFKQSISVGYTDLSEAQVKEVLHEISHEFVGTSYNLLTRNCNHFTHELCKKLTNKGAPGWINRAAKLGTMFPCVIPDEWIEPPEYEAENSTTVQSPTSVDSNSHPVSPAMSYTSRTPLKPVQNNRHCKHRDPSSQPSSPTRMQSSNSSSRPTSRHSLDARHYQQYRRGSGAASRRPSGSDHDSIVLARPSSPFANDDYNMDDPVKEPDSCRPEVMRSVTQLSISASLQDLDRPVSPRSPHSPV